MTSQKLPVMLVALALAAAAVAFTVQGVGDADKCDPSVCDDSTCRCSSTDTPANISAQKTPQFVVMSFDNAITVTNFPFYSNISSTYQNPNHCPITMSFFVSHENTDYTLVNKLWMMRHEIATHSVTNKADVENYWQVLTKEGFEAEMTDMRTMLDLYGKIDESEVKGFRVPYLEVGGNNMYGALLDSNFTYDCSWPTLQYTPWYHAKNEQPLGTLWPYTLDYMSIQEETVGTKPTDSFPGLWVNPMTDLQDDRGDACAMLDSCQSADNQTELDFNAQAVTDLLKRNFKFHYSGDRSPMGLYVHHSWFLEDNERNTTAHHDGFFNFLSYLSSFEDVYVVSVYQLIQWMQDPHDVDSIANFEPLKCDVPRKSDCHDEDNINCQYKGSNLPNNLTEVFMNICSGPCPDYYPWLGDPHGKGT